MGGGANFVPKPERKIIDDDGKSITLPEVCGHAFIREAKPFLFYHVQLTIATNRLFASNIIGAFFDGYVTLTPFTIQQYYGPIHAMIQQQVPDTSVFDNGPVLSPDAPVNPSIQSVDSD